ncbi:MAG: thiamine diphosphokinase [Treponema sp.]|jgi:thiamine pyrophosphokinase|nr:thiamine diphosphokinase [Treponema sp.]
MVKQSIMIGIAFIGGEGPTPPQSQRIVSAAASAGTLVVAADAGLVAAEAAGVRPDWIVGDMDSLDDTGRLARYPADRVLRYAPDKDYTDTELALALLWEHGATETWLIGGGGGRLDHLFALRALFERERCPDIWITGNATMYHIMEGNERHCSLPRGSLVSLFPLGAGPWHAMSRGLKWPLDALVWDRGFFGVSNVVENEHFAVSAEAGRFLLLLPDL